MRSGITEGKAFIHRFGSSLNEHVHFHCCIVDGVFEAADACDTGEAETAVFHAASGLDADVIAAHYLENRKADKKLMLILTDGEPANVDAKDARTLIEDARQAVKELDRKNIYAYCINLDPKANEYVSDIFGKRYTVIDNIQRLPEQLPEVFLALTK